MAAKHAQTITPPSPCFSHTHTCTPSLDLVQVGHVWLETGELLCQLPHSDDEEAGIGDDDDADGTEEAPDESVLQVQPAATCINIIIFKWFLGSTISDQQI